MLGHSLDNLMDRKDQNKLGQSLSFNSNSMRRESLQFLPCRNFVDCWIGFPDCDPGLLKDNVKYRDTDRFEELRSFWIVDLLAEDQTNIEEEIAERDHGDDFCRFC